MIVNFFPSLLAAVCPLWLNILLLYVLNLVFTRHDWMRFSFAVKIKFSFEWHPSSGVWPILGQVSIHLFMLALVASCSAFEYAFMIFFMFFRFLGLLSLFMVSSLVSSCNSFSSVVQALGFWHLFFSYSLLVYLLHHGWVPLCSGLESGL